MLDWLFGKNKPERAKGPAAEPPVDNPSSQTEDELLLTFLKKLTSEQELLEIKSKYLLGCYYYDFCFDGYKISISSSFGSLSIDVHSFKSGVSLFRGGSRKFSKSIEFISDRFDIELQYETIQKIIFDTKNSKEEKARLEEIEKFLQEE